MDLVLRKVNGKIILNMDLLVQITINLKLNLLFTIIKIIGINMSKELTLERLAQAIIETKKEVMYLKTELEKVQSYLREQHKLKKQLINKIPNG